MTTKAFPSLRFALTGAVAFFAYTTFAQTWQTVDDSLSADGFDAVAQAMGRDPFGNVYAAGYAVLNANYDFVAAIKKSGDGGATWSVIDNFSQGESTPSYEYLGIASDAAGILYAAGAGNIGWFVRQSLDSGVTWQTVDNIGGAARAVASDAAGNVYVAGDANSAWIVQGDQWRDGVVHRRCLQSRRFRPSQGRVLPSVRWNLRCGVGQRRREEGRGPTVVRAPQPRWWGDMDHGGCVPGRQCQWNRCGCFREHLCRGRERGPLDRAQERQRRLVMGHRG
jgi:hypothetical protein